MHCLLTLKALVNEDTLFRTHCFPWCFLGSPNWETFVADTKCSWTKSETFFVSATNVARAGKRGNICVGNNVSSFARSLTFLRALYMLFLFLGQCLNVALLDLVAAVVSLLTSCNIQTPSNIQRRQMRLRKNVNYCIQILLFLWIFESILNLKKDNRIKITVSVINKRTWQFKQIMHWSQHLFHLNKFLN